MSHRQHAPIAPKSSGRAARLAAGSLTTRFGKMSFQLPLRWSQSGVSLFQATRQAARQKLLALRSSGDMRSWPWFLGPGIHRARTTAATRTQEFLFLVRKVSVFAQNHLGTQSRRQMRVILLYRRPVGLFGVIFKGLKKLAGGLCIFTFSDCGKQNFEFLFELSCGLSLCYDYGLVVLFKRRQFFILVFLYLGLNQWLYLPRFERIPY